MITFVRTGAIAPGKAPGAIAFAQKIVAYWKDNYDRITFVSRYKDLAEFDATALRSTTDAKYMELLATAADLFIAGSIHDEIWRRM
jgi:hypothetical protein